MTVTSEQAESKGENEEFSAKAEAAFRSLFERARAANELQFALSLIPEMRGCREEGWNTATEARQAFNEYLAFLSDGEPTTLKARVALAFYCHLAEASGFYEIPKNLLRVAGGGFHSPWPFNDLVQVHAATGNVIAPNANKIIRNLAGHAETVGIRPLAEIFRDAFDGDIRNGFAHADYAVWVDGLRLSRRNGGYPRIVKWVEFNRLLERAINFFNILTRLVDEYVGGYHPPKKIVGVYPNGRRAECTIGYDPLDNSFSISDSAP